MSGSEKSEKKRPREPLATADELCPYGKRQKLNDTASDTLQSEKAGLTSNNDEAPELNEEGNINSGSDSKEFSKAFDVDNDKVHLNHELKFQSKSDLSAVERSSKETAPSKIVKVEEAESKSEFEKTEVKYMESKKNTGSVDDVKVFKNNREDQDDEKSALKSEGSNKENIDLGKDKSHPSDVIMLSDEEDDLKMFRNDVVESSTWHSHIVKKIKALQNQLRNEEATLVLLKKLRQSQIAHPQETIQQTLSNRLIPHHQQVNQLHTRPHGGPPPLVRNTQSGPKTLHNASQNAHMRTQQGNNQSLRSQQGPPPLVGVPRTSNGHGSMSQQPSHSSSHSNVTQNISRGNEDSCSQQQGGQRPAVVPPAPLQIQETPAQRQAAAKQALRKQLEKTLLQIPPPKPPPPEMNFIPSLACPDFILLLGLEEVVNQIIDYQLISRGQKNPDEQFVCTPFTCVQCGSDFTPVWKREKPGSKNVICEYCVTTNQKKALKQEHTNRLKSAFVKALQQEQEIERMQASSTPTPQPVISTTPQPHHPSVPKISAASAAAAAVSAAAAVASFRPSADQLSQQHSFFQQAQLRAGQPLGLQAFSRSPYSYNIPFVSQQDLQRQYLLDMIPRGGMNWKQ